MSRPARPLPSMKCIEFDETLTFDWDEMTTEFGPVRFAYFGPFRLCTDGRRWTVSLKGTHTDLAWGDDNGEAGAEYWLRRYMLHLPV